MTAKQKLLNLLPWRVKYILDFKDMKGRMPKLFGNRMDYSDYIFRDNLFGRHNYHAYLADKYRVREYVCERALSNILTKLYGVWENSEDIDFDSLPTGFALKCNHSCAMNIICQDKNQLDKQEALRKLNNWLKKKHELKFEQHYRKIHPVILCEELILCNKDGFFPIDYKVHCANGQPIFIQCCFERTATDAGRRVIYDTEWNNLHLVVNDAHYSDEEFPKPKHLDEILRYASILSKGLEYARVDFYDTDDRVIFGEITLTPMGGWLSYFKQEALDYMGRKIREYNK